MRKLFFLLALGITLAQFNAVAHASDNVQAGMPLWSQEGRSLGYVYGVTRDGAVKLIIDGRMITVPASTLSIHGGMVTTSLTKSEVYKLR